MKLKVMLMSVFLVLTILNPGCRCIYVGANRSADPYPIAKDTVVNGADPKLADQTNLTRVGLNPSSLPTASNVKVAVLGMGFDYSHEDLKGALSVNLAEQASGVEFANLNGVDDDGNGLIDDVYGYDFIDDDGFPFAGGASDTAAAGVIAAVANNSKGIAGIASGATLLPVRYIKNDGMSSVGMLIYAMKYALSSNVNVVYMRLPKINYKVKSEVTNDGETKAFVELVSQAEYDMINNLLGEFNKKNIPIIVNAGASAADLSSTNILHKQFASFENVMFVTSIDQNDRKTSVANYGVNSVLIAAPGVSIYSTLSGNQYGAETGTHMAAAQVAGAVAVAISQNGTIPVTKIRSALVTSADETNDLRHVTMSNGKLNITQFLADLKK